MRVDQIRELIETLESSDVAEIVIEEGDKKITLRKSGAPAYAAAQSAPVAAAPAAPAEQAPAPAAAAACDRPASWVAVTSPMVGTYYECPSPDAAPFVQVGDTVEEGQTLCIVEAMKLMNEIPANERCIVREVAVANGDLVNYGTALFYVELA